MIEGLLLIDKPAGVSSFGVVAKVRGVLRAHFGVKNIKVGHTGTLDPAATGLLVLAIGGYTKRVPELIKQDKTYEVTMKLGETSTTGDKEGELTKISTRCPTNTQLVEVLERFSGKLMQTPPSYSALKVNGQRAYQLARKGKAVKLQPRPVTIYNNSLIGYDYPYVEFVSEVGSGTYIRSLVEDIGSVLETGAYMSDLRRTKVGQFDVVEALTLEEISFEVLTEKLIKY